MQFLFVLVVMVGAGLVDQGEALSKCKEDLVGKIHKSWGGKLPDSSVDKIKAAGKQTVVGTSKDYFAGAKAHFPGLEKPELKCAFGIYKTDKYDITLVPKEGKPVTQGFKVEFKGDEATYETEGKKLKRYAFYIDGGVVGLYGCNDEGADADDTPDALIKVSEGYKKENVEAAKKKAKEWLGIDITETYPDKCEVEGGEEGGKKEGGEKGGEKGGEEGGEKGGKKGGEEGGKKEGGEGGKKEGQ